MDDDKARRKRAQPVRSAEGEQVFESTTWSVKRVMVRRAPQASVDSALKGHRWKKLPARNPRDPLSLTVKWRGGAEAWVEIHARGDFVRVPGWVPIADIVLMANSQIEGSRERF